MSQTSFKKIAEEKIQPKDFSFDKDKLRREIIDLL